MRLLRLLAYWPRTLGVRARSAPLLAVGVLLVLLCAHPIAVSAGQRVPSLSDPEFPGSPAHVGPALNGQWSDVQSVRPWRVYLVPLGVVSYLSYGSLASHYRQRFGLPLTVLDPVPLTDEQFDAGRGQYVAEALIVGMQTAYPALALDRGALLIGVTEHDMYLAYKPKWRFGFALREGGQVAVVSSARMDNAFFGDEPNPVLLHTRVRKMITKTVGLQFFGLPLSYDPRSVLYGSILSLDDLDAVSEDF